MGHDSQENLLQVGKEKGMDVFLSDYGNIPQRYAAQLEEENIPFEQGQHSEHLILNADEVVKSPGIPPTAPIMVKIAEKGIPVISEIEFAGRYTDAKMVCITGSNGKTTTTLLTYHILREAGINVGLAGNVGRSLALQVAREHHDVYVIELSSFQLENMYDFKANIAVITASLSPAKSMYIWSAALFLNLSPDHIGGAEHADFSEYRDCKAALFRQCRLAVGNADDPAWPAMAAQVPPFAPVHTFGFGWGADTRAVDAGPDPGRDFAVRLSVEGAAPYHVPMPGRFNAWNALAAVSLARTLGLDDGAIRAGLAHTSVPGRAQRFPAPAPYAVIIDYAHNGESLAALLGAVRECRPRRILAVLGAGGNRPKLRRADMGRAAALGADYAILTEDNPRWERTEDICGDIAAAVGGAIPTEITPSVRPSPPVLCS